MTGSRGSVGAALTAQLRTAGHTVIQLVRGKATKGQRLAIMDDSLEGPVNAASPNPVLNKDFVKALGAELHRPALLPVPPFGPAILLGKEGAQELALAQQRVSPTVLQNIGHAFRYPTIDAALAHELGGESLL